MTLTIVIIGVAVVAGLCIALQRRSSRTGETERDVPPIRPTADGTHQGRSPGADGGGMSYYNGG